jgi:hypothetical protein
MTATERSRRLRAQVDGALTGSLDLDKTSASVLLACFERAYRQQDRQQIGRIARVLLSRRGVAATRPENPEHQRLFAIPQGAPSASTALTVQHLPEQVCVTGDREVDACLWLGQVCRTATDLRVLDKALEASTRLTTSADVLEKRYRDWLVARPGAHALAGLSAFGLADIQRKVKQARERIRVNAEGRVVFGSYEAAMAHTPAEQMLAETVGELPEGSDDFWWKWSTEQLAEVFSQAVNPASLAECVTELQYWQWLYRIRKHMCLTKYLGGDYPDPEPLVSIRERYVEKLLTVLKPFDRAEARVVAQAVVEGELIYQAEDQVKILASLLA